MRHLLVRALPRDQLPELADPRWRYWSAELSKLLYQNPVDWGALECFGGMRGVSDMMLRNLVAYLESREYAASFLEPMVGGRVVLWCGCWVPCGIRSMRCPKLGRELWLRASKPW